MIQILYVFIKFVYYLLVAMQILIFGRAIMSWLMPDEDNMLSRFLYTVTDPVILPIRMLLEKFEFFRNLPIDVSIFVAYIILVIIQNILPAVF